MKPNVLLFVDSFNQGGSERQTVQLARLLSESGRFKVHLAALSGEGVLRQEAERLNIGEITEYPLTSFYDLNAAKQFSRLVRFMRAKRLQIVHTNDFYTNIFGTFAARFARVPVRIASRRMSTVGEFFSKRKQRLEHAAYRRAHVVLANAEAIRQEVIAEGVPEAKTVTVYNGLDLARLTATQNSTRAELLAAATLPAGLAERKVVTVVANMRHRLKDQATFLRAAREVRAQVKDAVFVLAGEGELVDEMKALATELGLSNDAYFPGRVGRVAELLAASDVCVLSSKGVEGFSNSIIEYMAARRPVVATDIGGAREAIVENETGFVIPPEQPDMMAERIVRLLQNPQLAAEMGARGRARVEREFSCEAQLRRTEELYERLLKQNSVRMIADGDDNNARVVGTTKGETTRSIVA